MEMTLEQKRALAKARARARIGAEQAPAAPDINKIRAEVKAENAAKRGKRDFNIMDLSPIGAGLRAIEAMDTLEPGEAPVSAKVGRGMLDVYQGTEQLGKHVGRALTENPTSIHSIAARVNPITAPIAALLEGTYKKGDVEKVDQKIKDEISLYDENNPGFEVSRLVGNAATPLALMPAGAGSASATAVTAALMGTVAASTQPVTGDDFWNTKGQQAATGFVLGPAMVGLGKALGPVAKKTIGGLKRLSPFGKKAVDRDIVDDIVSRLGGTKEEITKNKALVIRALNEADDDMTVAQAIAKANRESPDEFGRVLVKADKEIRQEAGLGEALSSRYGQQKAARKGVVEALGGTDQNIKHLEQVRSKTTKPFYDLAKKSEKKIDTQPVMDRVDELISDNKNQDVVVAPLKKIKEKLMDGEVLDTSPKNLQSLSKDIGDMMNVTDAAGKKLYSQSTLTQVKKLLDDQIGASERAYKIAKQLHEARSGPVNRAQIGKTLNEALTSPSERETAAAFTRTLSDIPKTIKKATKFGKGKSLQSSGLSKADIESISKVQDQLITNAKAGEMAGGTGNVVKEMSTRGEVSLPKILSRPIVITNALLRRLSQGHSAAYKAELSKVLQDPKHLSKLMSPSATSAQRKMAGDIMKQLTALSATQTTARGQNDAP